jgi:HPt (histidine-containing phosphotransfer) domain-containing protein
MPSPGPPGPPGPPRPGSHEAGALPADALDLHVFGKLIALESDEPGFLAELVGEFQQGVTRRLAAIADAIEVEDWKALAAAAHSLRGSCGTVGARRMAALAGRMEDEPPSTRATASPLLAQLQSEYEAVRRAIDAAVAAARASGQA